MQLANYLEQNKIDTGLGQVIMDIACAAIDLSTRLDTDAGVTVGDENFSGDAQIKLDVLADNLFTEAMRHNTSVYAVASEEQDEIDVVHEDGKYVVAFDPLDGSSLVSANFAVGSIFGIYETKSISGTMGQQMPAAVYVMYGPQVMLTVAVGDKVASFTMHKACFFLDKDDLSVATETSYFAPGNLRAVNQNPGYKQLVAYWIDNDYKLRYSGGMVPDIHHILYKGHGVFSYPGMPDQPDGKLRLLYECMPMAKIVETAGGKSSDGKQSILLKNVVELHQRTQICVGSVEEVERFEELLNQ